MAFSTTNAVVLTGTMVTVGKWANDEPLSIRVVVGGAFLAVGLATMAEIAPDLAGKFATLVVVVSAFMYLPVIAYRLGLTNIKPPEWGGNGARKVRTRPGSVSA